MVTALSEQRGWIDVTAPADVSIDGFAGKEFRRTTPADLSACLEERFHTATDGTSVYKAGETVTVYVLDVNGTIVVIETRVDVGASEAARDELAGMIDSIRIAAG
jgi:hypothetical protein